MRRSQPNNYQPRIQPNNYPNQSLPINNSSEKFCRYCKSNGHLLEECTLRAYNNARRNEQIPYQRTQQIQHNQQYQQNLTYPRQSQTQQQPQRHQLNREQNRSANRQETQNPQGNSRGLPQVSASQETNRHINLHSHSTPNPINNRRGNDRTTRVTTIRLERKTRVPTVQISSKELDKPTIFMVDTGSEPNLIKIEAISSHVPINEKKIVKLCGITAQHVFTLGTVEINITGLLIQFHVVPNDFPISCSGILGTEFLVQANAKINYAKNCLEWESNCLQFTDREIVIIPARS